MKWCPNVSVSIRDHENALNAIEWLEYRVKVNRDQLESDSDPMFK